MPKINSRTKVICKGKVKGLPCSEPLCETDGRNLFVQVNADREFVITVNERGERITCPICDYETFWKFGMQGIIIQ